VHKHDDNTTLCTGSGRADLHQQTNADIIYMYQATHSLITRGHFYRVGWMLRPLQIINSWQKPSRTV